MNTLTGAIECCCHCIGAGDDGKEFTFRFSYRNRNIFSWQGLQAIIESLPSKKLQKDFVRRLNSHDPQTVHSAEWELVLMDWFRQIGTIQYEVEQENGRKPDILFSTDNDDLEIIGDVATVSDATIKDLYPASQFLSQVEKILIEDCGKRYGFSLVMKSSEEKNFNMFAPARMSKYIDLIKKWVEENGKYFECGRVYRIDVEDNTVEVFVTDKDTQRMYSYPARIYSNSTERNNPVYNILESKASRQLASYKNKIVGIFLCDGGCMILNTKYYGHNEVRLDDIITRIFKEHDHIDFIVTFSIYGMPSRPQFELYLNNTKSTSNSKIEKVKLFRSLLVRNASRLMFPVMHPNESSQEIRRNDKERCYYEFVIKEVC